MAKTLEEGGHSGRSKLILFALVAVFLIAAFLGVTGVFMHMLPNAGRAAEPVLLAGVYLFIFDIIPLLGLGASVCFDADERKKIKARKTEVPAGTAT